MRTKLKFIKRVVYKLKKSYGLPIDYYQMATHTLDTESGTKVITLTKTRIERAIVLRAREFRSFVYDLAFISANKDFTTGGFFDPEDRRVIIDASDVAIDFIPTVDDYFIYDNRKYEVKEIQSLESNSAYLLLARRLRGAPITRIEDVASVLDLGQTLTSTTQDRLTRTVETTLSLTHTFSEVP